jgi:hypothetical protein
MMSTQLRLGLDREPTPADLDHEPTQADEDRTVACPAHVSSGSVGAEQDPLKP